MLAGLLDNTSHPSSARGATPPLSPSPAAATAAAGSEQGIPRQPLSKAPLPHADPQQVTAAAPEAAARKLAPNIVTAAQVPVTSPAAVGQIPVSSATAAGNRPQLPPNSSSVLEGVPDSTLAPITSAMHAAVALPHIAANPAAAAVEAAGITTDTPAATAKVAVTTAGAAATAAGPEATTQDAAADIYSPIRSPPPSTVEAPSIPTLASLPPPQLNPLPPPPQVAYQQPVSMAGVMPYATPEQMAAWQQQQAYQGYYANSYPYSDPAYGYAYAQMTQPHPSFGVAPSAPFGVSTPQAPAGAVAPPRPPPLGPTSPPPKHPISSNLVSTAASSSQQGAQAGQSAAALPHACTASAPSASAAWPAAVTPSPSMSGESSRHDLYFLCGKHCCSA